MNLKLKGVNVHFLIINEIVILEVRRNFITFKNQDKFLEDHMIFRTFFYLK